MLLALLMVAVEVRGHRVQPDEDVACSAAFPVQQSVDAGQDQVESLLQVELALDLNLLGVHLLLVDDKPGELGSSSAGEGADRLG